jgi:hypothetical protein
MLLGRGSLVALVCLGAAARVHATEYTYVRLDHPGRYVCATRAPASTTGWESPGYDDRAWLDGTQIPDAGSGCAGTRLQRITFDVGPELERLAALTLRVRYAHGLVAYLNGVEVARRALDPGAPVEAVANDWHGADAERIFVSARPGALRRSGNLLALEVHPRTAGRDPVLEVEVSGTDGPRIVRGPYLRNLSERDVIVAFDTDLPSLAAVRYGTTADLGAQVNEGAPTQHHALRIGGLRAGTSYHYRAVVGNPMARVAQLEGGALPAPDSYDSGDASFHTPPARGEPLRFIVYGDVRSGHDIHAQLNRAMLDEDPDLALVTGDLVDHGSDEGGWDRFFEVAATLLRQVAIFPAIGNHEYARLGRGAQRFFQLFRWPLQPGEEEAGYYSFDIAGVHFVALDSNQYRSPRQVKWLDQDLSRARRRGARAIFVYAHEGPYSSGLHGDNALCIHDYVPVLERHHVTMFFGGHDHHYERGHVGALDYLVSGGGGAELRAPRCGVPGKRACPPRVLAYANEHHYVLVEVMPSFFRLCPKRPDGTPIEACVSLPLAK